MATWNVYDVIDAITFGSYEDLVTHLKSGKFDLNKSDGSRRTPLDYCAIGTAVNYNNYKDEEVMDNTGLGKARLLLKYGADPNVQDPLGWTIVHQCAINGNLPLLQLCVQKGADVNIRNRNGQLPIDLAVIKHHEPVVRYLENQSCNLRCLCRQAIRDAMGKRTYNQINKLPLPSTIKLFVNYYNPFPGFTATVHVPRPWTEEDVACGRVKKKDVIEFFEENASEEFISNKKFSQRTTPEELAEMLESLYFWESFRTIDYEEPLARKPRYSMEPRKPCYNMETVIKSDEDPPPPSHSWFKKYFKSK